MEDNQKIIYGVIEFIEKNLSEKLSLDINDPLVNT